MPLVQQRECARDEQKQTGKAVATIDASAARVFADWWCQNSHEHKKDHVEKEGPDAFHKVVFMKDSHNMLGQRYDWRCERATGAIVC